MVKMVVFFKRKPGMSVEAFQNYWRATHAGIVVKMPGIRKYVQSHTLLSGYRKGEPAYDGIAEVWLSAKTGSGVDLLRQAILDQYHTIFTIAAFIYCWQSGASSSTALERQRRHCRAPGRRQFTQYEWQRNLGGDRRQHRR